MGDSEQEFNVETYEKSGQASFDDNITKLHKSYVEQELEIDPAFHELALTASIRLNKYWSIIYSNSRAGANGNAVETGDTGKESNAGKSLDSSANEVAGMKSIVHPDQLKEVTETKKDTTVGTGATGKDSNTEKSLDSSANEVAGMKTIVHPDQLKEVTEAKKDTTVETGDTSKDSNAGKSLDSSANEVTGMGIDLLQHQALENQGSNSNLTTKLRIGDYWQKSAPVEYLEKLGEGISERYQNIEIRANIAGRQVVVSKPVQYFLGATTGLGLNVRWNPNDLYKKSDDYQKAYSYTNAIGNVVIAPLVNAAITLGGPPTTPIPPLAVSTQSVATLKSSTQLVNTGANTNQLNENFISGLNRLFAKETENTGKTESPALKNSPYNPDTVEKRVKPEYKANPAHDPRSPLFNPRKTPEPNDAAQVYENAVRGEMGTWYGKGADGQIYRYFSDNAGGVHFSGSVSKGNVPKDILKQLGIKY